MKLSEYTQFDGLALADLIRSKRVSAEEVKQAALQACDTVNGEINAVVESWDDEKIHPSAEPDAPFYGVPFLVKDMGVSVAGQLSELGSRLAKGLRSKEDSTLMKRFRAAGLVAVGRATTPEFGISTTTEAVSVGPTKNPWNLAHSSGGSSGGSGAAVAAGVVPIAHATDGGGSIRIPASANGIFGLKPTRGRVSNGPAIDEIWSGFGVQLGVSRSVRDSAALLDVAAATAKGEPYYTQRGADTFLSGTERKPGALKIGLMVDPPNGFSSSEPVTDALEQTGKLCESLGHHVEQVRFDPGVSWDAFVLANARVWTTATTAWVDAIASMTGRTADSSNLEPVTLNAYDYGRNVSAIEYLSALDIRNTVSRSLAAYFDDYDILLTPTLPELPAVLGQLYEGATALNGAEWINRVFNNSPFTALANMTGVPAISVPLGHDANTNLPIGSMFFAAFAEDARLLSLGAELERAAPWQGRRPRVWAAKT
jgi:amidase